MAERDGRDGRPETGDGGKKKGSLTGRIREALPGFGGREIGLDDLGDRLGIQTRADLKKVRYALRDMVKQGEVEKIGVNLYKSVVKQASQPSKQEVMWRVLRARRSVTLEDLVELAGAEPAWAGKFMRSLVSRGVVRACANGKYCLRTDPVELPKNEAKAEYLRNRREAKKKALAALDAVFAAVAEARMAVAGLEE